MLRRGGKGVACRGNGEVIPLFIYGHGLVKVVLLVAVVYLSVCMFYVEQRGTRSDSVCCFVSLTVVFSFYLIPPCFSLFLILNRASWALYIKYPYMRSC